MSRRPPSPFSRAASSRARAPTSTYAARGCGAASMAKAELSGTVISFRQSKHRQDSYQTIVHIADRDRAGTLMGARVVWLRKDGLQIHGRGGASHGSKGGG